jgi:hypothetical protein
MDTLEAKINRRCTFIESAIVDCYNVTGPFDITVDVDPPGAGDVKLNSIWLNNFVWSGKYFGGVKMSFEQTVLDTSKYEFDYWEFKNHIPSMNTTDDSVSIQLTTSDNVIAHYIEKNKEVVFPTAFTPNGDGRNDLLSPLGVRNENKYSTIYYTETAYTTTDHINLTPTNDLDIENSIYDNNLGFFKTSSKGVNPFMKEIEDKINAEKQKIAELNDKRKMVMAELNKLKPAEMEAK